MKKIDFTIAAGLGDNLVMRIFCDTVKHEYEEITFAHCQDILSAWRNNDPKYRDFLNETGNILFSEKPYKYVGIVKKPVSDTAGFLCRMSSPPKTPNLSHLLCKGVSLNLGEEYIVITTKIRAIPKRLFLSISIKFWEVLQELSKRYKIVVLGEREIEMSKENFYNKDTLFGIYDQIIANIPDDRIVDLTVPALGITVPDWSKLYQDFLIMKEAKFVVTFGIGGNLWMAMSVANVIGFRNEIVNDGVTDIAVNPKYETAFLTKNWLEFLNKLKAYK